MGTASDLAVIIELAVAPVFLLAGIAGFLGVMSGRLGRIIDRARVLEGGFASKDGESSQAAAYRELTIIWRRVKFIHWAIGLCTIAALMICCVIVSLFIGGFWAIDIVGAVVVLFVTALLLLIAALMLFLNEVRLSTHTLRMDGEYRP